MNLKQIFGTTGYYTAYYIVCIQGGSFIQNDDKGEDRNDLFRN